MVRNIVFFFFLIPCARTARFEEALFSLEIHEKKARFARAPHYNDIRLYEAKSLTFWWFQVFILYHHRHRNVSLNAEKSLDARYNVM